ncbi:MAG: ATP-binding protein, partial [Nannocystaceae bacterium]
MDEAVEQILARLIGQFRSPYDFCRELVQNAMDGGAGRVDVSVDVHEDTEQECVMEVRFDDTGRGMTAVVVRDELTRLFASSKRHDRTSAGEFGVGFVSVFGWRPDAVLLQTGREGEAWELIFDGSAQFEQRRVDQPLEGTSVVLLKRVARSALPEVTAKIRDALHRWCRYCPIEITFEDLYSGSAPASISVGWPDDDAIDLAEVNRLNDQITQAPRAVFVLTHLIANRVDPIRFAINELCHGRDAGTLWRGLNTL